MRLRGGRKRGSRGAWLSRCDFTAYCVCLPLLVTNVGLNPLVYKGIVPRAFRDPNLISLAFSIIVLLLLSLPLADGVVVCEVLLQVYVVLSVHVQTQLLCTCWHHGEDSLFQSLQKKKRKNNK